MILIQQCEVFTPSFIGKKDVLVAGEKIIAIQDNIEPPKGIECEVINGNGRKLIPGLIDGHVHIAGAGGEGGPLSRTPELQLSQLLEGGITTVIGCLGTDGFTRSVMSVLMKVKSLRAEGVSAWMLTGSYQVPTPTITGDVGKDVALIEEIIGVGEVAISDHRSSCPTTTELIRLAEHARVGGMLGGKAGIVNLHMGDGRKTFRPIIEAIENSELKYKQFIPTHVNRNEYIFEDAKEYGKNGYIDITASAYPYFSDVEVKPSKAVKILLEAGVPIEHITMTSDACGSLPRFDRDGFLTKMDIGKPSSIFNELVDMITKDQLPIEIALQPVTISPAKAFKLLKKGRIEIGMDADLVVLNADFKIEHLIARGTVVTRNGIMLRKGTYE
jgi:beta-aspartyl-dipeptidase (metallo-type)